MIFAHCALTRWKVVSTSEQDQNDLMAIILTLSTYWRLASSFRIILAGNPLASHRLSERR